MLAAMLCNLCKQRLTLVVLVDSLQASWTLRNDWQYTSGFALPFHGIIFRFIFNNPNQQNLTL